MTSKELEDNLSDDGKSLLKQLKEIDADELSRVLSVFMKKSAFRKKREIIRSCSDFSKISGNLFWACRSVEKHPLGSGEWFGTILDHLECIRSDFKEKKFSTFFENFSSIFQRILACF